MYVKKRVSVDLLSSHNLYLDMPLMHYLILLILVSSAYCANTVDLCNTDAKLCRSSHSLAEFGKFDSILCYNAADGSGQPIYCPDPVKYPDFSLQSLAMSNDYILARLMFSNVTGDLDRDVSMNALIMLHINGTIVKASGSAAQVFGIWKSGFVGSTYYCVIVYYRAGEMMKQDYIDDGFKIVDYQLFAGNLQTAVTVHLTNRDLNSVNTWSMMNNASDYVSAFTIHDDSILYAVMTAKGRKIIHNQLTRQDIASRYVYASVAIRESTYEIIPVPSKNLLIVHYSEFAVRGKNPIDILDINSLVVMATVALPYGLSGSITVDEHSGMMYAWVGNCTEGDDDDCHKYDAQICSIDVVHAVLLWCIHDDIPYADYSMYHHHHHHHVQVWGGSCTWCRASV